MSGFNKKMLILNVVMVRQSSQKPCQNIVPKFLILGLCKRFKRIEDKPNIINIINGNVLIPENAGILVVFPDLKLDVLKEV
jgi:hypothetical protein